MKLTKVSIIALLNLLILTSTSCEAADEAIQIDEVAQKVIDDINKIGVVELDDEELIKKTEYTYSTLTDNQKEQVSNYTTLLSARDQLDILIEDSKKLNENERIAYDSIIHLKNYLKDPSSLQIHSIQVSEYGIMCAIDYSAQNGFGGNNRDVFVAYYNIDDQFEEDCYILQDAFKDLWKSKVKEDGDKIDTIDITRVMAAFDDPDLLN